jgi:hypothetical protein
MSITRQLAEGKQIMDGKWNNTAYIAYFQNYTNTYGNPEKLQEAYDEALSFPGVCGIAIATRPDCIPDNILELLEEYNNKTFLWIELGLQTSNQRTADMINRGYQNDVFTDAFKRLHARGIKTVVHLIAGLPGEKKNDFLESVKFVNDLSPWGIKFHSIFIQRNSPLYKFSLNHGFEPLDMYSYIDWLTDGLLLLNDNVVLHRLTGDPDKKMLHKPQWQKDKLRVLSEIRRIFMEKAADGTL